MPRSNKQNQHLRRMTEYYIIFNYSIYIHIYMARGVEYAPGEDL